MINRSLRILLLLGVVAAVVWGSRSRLQWVRALQPRASADAAETAAVDTTRVLRGPFTLNVTATGKLRARTTETVRTEMMEGKLVWIAADGAALKKGDVLARLDDEELKRQVRDVGLEYENAKAEIEKQGRDRELETRNSQAAVDKANEEQRILLEGNQVQIRQAKEELNFRKAELDRLTAEFKRKKLQAEELLIPKVQLEEAEIALRTAEFAKSKAEKDLDLQEKKAASAEEQKKTELENTRFQAETAQRRVRDEAEAAKSKLQNIKQRLDESKQRLQWCILRAPVSGLVVLIKDWWGNGMDGRRVPRPGDQLWPHKAIADIPDLSVMAIDCKIPERNISVVKVDQPVDVRLDERPNQAFHGRVARISSVASEVSTWDDATFDPGTRVFTVTVEMREGDSKRLIPGMNATMEIVTRRVPTAVYLPKQCVFDRGAEHVVYVRRRNSFEAVPVIPGEENDKHVRIRTGLKGGEWVATSDPTRVIANG
jgi:multidrug efflux pump subunit AcrA (membrane-fusion protein)